MNDADHDRGERQYVNGYNSAYRELLQVAIRGLGYENVSREQALLLLSQTTAALRSVCGEFGDNDWDDDLHPADIVEKHLSNHLREVQRLPAGSSRRVYVHPLDAGSFKRYGLYGDERDLILNVQVRCADGSTRPNELRVASDVHSWIKRVLRSKLGAEPDTAAEIRINGMLLTENAEMPDGLVQLRRHDDVLMGAVHGFTE